MGISRGDAPRHAHQGDVGCGRPQFSQRHGVPCTGYEHLAEPLDRARGRRSRSLRRLSADVRGTVRVPTDRTNRQKTELVRCKQSRARCVATRDLGILLCGREYRHRHCPGVVFGGTPCGFDARRAGVRGRDDGRRGRNVAGGSYTNRVGPHGVGHRIRESVHDGSARLISDDEQRRRVGSAGCVRHSLDRRSDVSRNARCPSASKEFQGKTFGRRTSAGSFKEIADATPRRNH